ncbi:TetR family transcriptional regulator [Kribbella sp. NPDC026611]|uniref:TetR/AcrR family transcriptional regulator n=1 Tax=Kribbella sp. NPDC026611 TaxID=3154911 RepID=UPI0033F69393
MPRPPRIDRASLLAASLELLDAEGAGGLSMRAVADRLQVKPASLYNHVTGKEELNQLIADAVWLRVVDGLTAGTGWRPFLSALARQIRETLRAHPGAAQILAVTNVSAATYEPLIPVVADAFSTLDIAAEDALFIASSLSVLAIGLALAEFGDAPNPPVAPREYYDHWFELAVETFLDGIAARFPQEN